MSGKEKQAKEAGSFLPPKVGRSHLFCQLRLSPFVRRISRFRGYIKLQMIMYKRLEDYVNILHTTHFVQS